MYSQIAAYLVDMTHALSFGYCIIKQMGDSMRKPAWYSTSDYIPMFANEHVLNLTFLYQAVKLE